MFDWNDLRYFLAVARTGSTLSASRQLKVSQSTAARRIAALEASLGQTLFDKLQSGYRLTTAGEALIATAEQAEAAMADFSAAAQSQSRTLSGTVRLTTAELYAVNVVAPLLREFRAIYPDIRIELLSADEFLDLGRGEADVALRAGSRPTELGLVGRRVAYDPWSVYCSRDYARAHGLPASPADMKHHAIVGGGGDAIWTHYRRWLRTHGLEGAVAIHQNTLSGLLAAVRAGVGMAVLSGFVADRDPDLVRCFPPEPEHISEIWLLTHERLRQVPHVRAVVDFIADNFASPIRAGVYPSKIASGLMLI